MASKFEIRMSRSKKAPYFFNTETHESFWDAPPELTAEDIQKLPGYEQLSGSATKTGSEKPSQVRASHLLVKHEGSRRPSSWKEQKITRSKKDAEALLQQYANEIGGDPEKFAALAKVHSDDSSHDRGGDLGFFSPGQMQKPFEEAAYALQVGEMSDIVSTDSGVHLILRTA